ncbi:related to carboxypeptidase [Phialocephala subalpina]|uniref:Carboxypeptidase n=1 Tax=Phialocephala subalpina TaxID=576137 RepID=A0A1L7XID9_9HELO|nr:related to carboxypeptidase [Phialocephala subalpina]
MRFCSAFCVFWTLVSIASARDKFTRDGFSTVKSYADTVVRYKQVAPRICEQDPTIKSFSGYVDISPEEHIFFRILVNEGLFQENGPCSIDTHGNVVANPYPWSNSGNMVYIDQLAGVGFSYSTPRDEHPYSVTESTVQAAPCFWRTLLGSKRAFPQYSQNGFHLATESYGGHFGPIFSMYIAEQNVIQFQAHYNFTVSPGNTYDFTPFNESVASIIDRYEFDIREQQPHQFPPKDYLQYLGSPTLQDAIGVSTNYGSSQSVIDPFDATGDDARGLDILDIMATLLEMGDSITMYAGDADYSCNWIGGEAVAHEVGRRVSLSGLFTASYMNISTADDVVHGQVKQSGILSFSRVYDSEHEVPAYQPLAALAMFERAILGRDIATGGVKVGRCFKTSGETISSYHQGNISLGGL